MKSPTIFDQALMISVSWRSRNPSRCISFGTKSAGDCQRSAGFSFLEGHTIQASALILT
jgi:hypothetical protein